jgi:ubiquinone biosynthesis protein
MKRSAFVARSIVIALVGVSALIWYGAARFTIVGDSEDHEQRRVARLRGRVIRWALETLGATFIKLGQVMSTRPDLFPPEMIAELKMLQDRLPPFPNARAVIEKELGRPIDEVFAELDETPVAAASVAQVHRGVLLDGTEVAVKVLRPDVRARAESDGEILLFDAGLLMKISERAAHADLVGHLEHFIHGIIEQTDLRIEAANYEKFRKNFRRVKKVRFPKVYAELSGERLLVMEFLRGEKIVPEHKARFPDLPGRLREAFLKMCFEDGLLHADLHPGNFVIEADGTIAIYDVGLATQLSEESLVYYIDFNRCLVMGEVADYMRHLRAYHSYMAGTVDWDELEQDVAAFSAEWRSLDTASLEMGALIQKIFDVGRKHGVRPRTEMTLMMVGVVTAEGIGKFLDPGVNSFQEVSNFLLPVLARRGMLTNEVMMAAAEAQSRQMALSA